MRIAGFCPLSRGTPLPIINNENRYQLDMCDSEMNSTREMEIEDEEVIDD